MLPRGQDAYPTLAAWPLSSSGARAEATAAEWTLASVLKTGGYKTFGEADYALPIAHGYDEMRYVGLYHLKLTSMGIRPGFRTWIPDRVRCSSA